MKRVVYIGNRNYCFRVLEDNPQYSIVAIFAVTDSYLSRYLDEKGIDYIGFSNNDKVAVIDRLKTLPYDILVSNGCPFILPAEELMSQGKMLLNTHPTYLPHLRGATPLNGVLWLNYNFMGATTHYIGAGIDSGNIICQKKVPMTSDIDLGLVYDISFGLEEDVFREALRILEQHDFDYTGIPMNTKEGCYFNRKPEMQTMNPSEESALECLRKIRSFGIVGQGTFCELENINYIIYDAENIFNSYLISKYEGNNPGTIVKRYDGKMLLKCKTGILKITRYELRNE